MSRRDQIRMAPGEIEDPLSGRHAMNVASSDHGGTIHLLAMGCALLDGDPVLWTDGRSQKMEDRRRDRTVSWDHRKLAGAS